MKELVHKYRAVIGFVVLFIGTYFVLSGIYFFYLEATTHNQNSDPITQLVATQSSLLLESLGYDAQVVSHGVKPQMKLIVDTYYIANIIEGCNGISVLILFVAFVIAFAEKFKKTALFIVGGVALIYSVNIMRIALLAIALYAYPAYENILHGVVFPGIIYGMVFLLWVLWVRTLKKTY